MAKTFGISRLSGVGSPNPDLNCSSLIPGQQVKIIHMTMKIFFFLHLNVYCSTHLQVCIIRGPPIEFPLCTKPYTLKQGETCQTVINSKLNGSAKLFYRLNPGLYCDILTRGNFELAPPDTVNTRMFHFLTSFNVLVFLYKQCRFASIQQT